MNTFKLTSFQENVLNDYNRSIENHYIISAPTGSGKGTIIEEFIRNQTLSTLIIVPLSALGRQTEIRLKSKNCNASYLNKETNLNIQTLIICPESLNSLFVKNWLKNCKNYFLIIDECHCIEEWGYSFRPSFYQIYELINEKKPIGSLWLSATLPKNHFELFKKKLSLNFKIKGNFKLSNQLKLKYFQCTPLKREEFILNFILNEKINNLLFCNTRKQTENLSLLCKKLNILNFFYHAGLSLEERIHIESKLFLKQSGILFATSAFGMGMNFDHFHKSLITFIPHNLISLFQNFGRVGRGKNEGEGILLWSESDFRIHSLSQLNLNSMSELKTLRFFLECKNENEKNDFITHYFI